MENQPVLQVEHLTKHFPAGKKNVVHAVDDVSFTLQKGRTFGLPSSPTVAQYCRGFSFKN